MKNKSNLPGFLNEDKINSSNVFYSSNSMQATNGNTEVVPQYRSRVRRVCSPCRNGKKICSLFGFECTVSPGLQGSDELGIPSGAGSISCEPAIFRVWTANC